MIEKQDLFVILRRPIAFYPMYAVIGGSVNAGLFLSQLFYWSDKGSDPEGWVYKSHAEWTEETMLTRHEQVTARKHLVDIGVLQERLSNTVPATNLYRIDFDTLLQFLNRQPVVRKAYNQLSDTSKLDVREAYNPYTESTTETTTESTPERDTDAHTQDRAVGNEWAAGQPVGPISYADTSIPPNLTTARADPIMPATPITPTLTESKVELLGFSFSGKKRQSTTKGTLAPDSVTINAEGMQWAAQAGWRANLEALQITADTCLDYYKSKGERRVDWEAVLRNWVRRTIKENDDLKFMMHGAVPVSGMMNNNTALTNVQEDNANGPRSTQKQERQQQQQQRAGTYGYNSAGAPTNKSSQLLSVAEQLAQHQRDRRQRMADDVGEDAAAQCDADRSGH